MSNKKNHVFEGLWRDNTILSSLMVISPVIVCGDTLRNAEALIYAFSAITLLSVLISSFVPKKLPYAAKIVVYALISSLVYIPVKLAAQEFFPGVVGRVGIYFPLLAVNSLIVFQTEAKFFRMPKKNMLISLISYILGFDAVMLISSFIRELFTYGTVNSRMVDMKTLVSGLGMPFGGFIFLGLLCGLYRFIRSLFMHEEKEDN